MTKRPQEQLLKADATKREAFVAAYVAVRQDAGRLGAKIFFVDEAHSRADADLRWIWVLKGEPALVDAASPRLAGRVTYHSAVCLETVEVRGMEVAETCTAETSTAFLQRSRAHLTSPDLGLRLVSLPG